MITYEVNLAIDNVILDNYYHWLIEHVKQMLQFDGFISAEIAKEKTPEKSTQTKITVWYTLNSEESLNHYLENFATAMREDGIKRFGNKFSATRRIFINSIKIDA